MESAKKLSPVPYPLLPSRDTPFPRTCSAVNFYADINIKVIRIYNVLLKQIEKRIHINRRGRIPFANSSDENIKKSRVQNRPINQINSQYAHLNIRVFERPKSASLTYGGRLIFYLRRDVLEKSHY